MTTLGSPDTRSDSYSGCSNCYSRWGGLKTAHCSACHKTFTTPWAFDKHRDGSHVTGRFCREPEAVGLVDAGRAYPCWGRPNDNREWTGPAK
jgi:hypothetical protein